MSEMSPLGPLLKAANLAERAVWVSENLVRMQWGSAFVLVGVSGQAIVAIAPLFRTVPHGKELAFFRKLLQHNAYMGGMAAFAIQPDGWIVLHSGRALKGLDGDELATMVAGVGKFADQFDDQLIAEFYMDQTDATNQAPLGEDATD
jgi:hypothetical protein